MPTVSSPAGRCWCGPMAMSPGAAPRRPRYLRARWARRWPTCRDGPETRRSVQCQWASPSRAELVVRRDDAEFLQEGQPIGDPPALGQPAVGDAPDEEGAETGVPIGGAAPSIVAGVGSDYVQEGGDTVSFGDQVQHLDAKVGEGQAQAFDAAANRLRPGGRVQDDRVMGHDVGGDERVDEVEVALVKALLVEPSHERLVGREVFGHQAASQMSSITSM